jgi:hypothetical protein
MRTDAIIAALVGSLRPETSQADRDLFRKTLTDLVRAAKEEVVDGIEADMHRVSKAMKGTGANGGK